MKVVVASDKYKGCLTSQEVGRAISAGINDAIADAEVTVVGIADGGDGIAAAIGATDAVVIETAQIVGLAITPEECRNPLVLSTRRVGEAIRGAIESGARRIIVGLGGSATCDGGSGLLAAMGARFCDRCGIVFEPCGGADLERIAEIDIDDVLRLVAGVEIIGACDVDNPLCGERGAARVFAPQKGADAVAVERIERGMVGYGALLGAGVAEARGAGAAGGMGAALIAMGGRLCRGIDIVLDEIDFDGLIADADLVITGEGHIDGQTVMGKAPWGVILRCISRGVRVAAFGGQVDDDVDIHGCELIEVSDRSRPLSEEMRPEVARQRLRAAAAKFIGKGRY